MLQCCSQPPMPYYLSSMYLVQDTPPQITQKLAASIKTCQSLWTVWWLRRAETCFTSQLMGKDQAGEWLSNLPVNILSLSRPTLQLSWSWLTCLLPNPSMLLYFLLLSLSVPFSPSLSFSFSLSLCPLLSLSLPYIYISIRHTSIDPCIHIYPHHISPMLKAEWPVVVWMTMACQPPSFQMPMVIVRKMPCWNSAADSSGNWIGFGL